jgi:hypothetical protein
VSRLEFTVCWLVLARWDITYERRDNINSSSVHSFHYQTIVVSV